MFAKIRKNKELLLLMLVTNIVFVILFWKTIFGGRSFLFFDIGSDTYAQYYPNFIFYSNTFKGGKMFEYSFQMGLGACSADRIISMLNPFEFVLLLCNQNTMHIGILISTWLKINAISVLSFLYFGKLFKDKKTNMICALMWTFSGYVILWGQHYAFMTNIAYFTLFMLALQDYLENNRLFSWVIPIAVFLFSLNGYYFIYMVGLFSVIYIVVFSIYRKYKLKYIAKKILGLGLMALLGILMASITIIVSVGAFMESSRSNGFSYGRLDKLINFRDTEYRHVLLSRFLSNNIVGVGNEYCGWGNYYEAPMVATSIISVFALPYIFKNKNRNKNIFFFMMGVFCLLCPLVSIIFTGFSGEYLRWTFTLTLCIIICIGYMMDSFFTKCEFVEKEKSNIAIWGLGIYFIMVYMVVTFFGDRVNKRVVAMTVVWALVYYFWMLMYKSKKKIWEYCIVLCVALEMITANYYSINQRGLATKEQTHLFTDDGTNKMTQFINDNDDGLFRTVKGYQTLSLNDALAQNYNSLSWYESVFPSSVIEYIYNNDIPRLMYDTCIHIPCEEYEMQTLLGVKYGVGISGYEWDSQLFDKIYSDGEKDVYVNKYYLPFGYLYYSYVDGDQIKSKEKTVRNLKLTESFYYTNSAPDNRIIENSEFDNWTQEKLISNLVNLRDNGLQEIEYRNNKLTGVINNKATNSAMLCFPIFFENSWHVCIDGKEQDLVNINGGLMGTVVSPGEHYVELKYENEYLKYGAIMSIIGCIIYIMAVIGTNIIRRKTNKN